MTSYDGQVYSKVFGVYPVTYRTATGDASYIINWGNSGSSGTGI